MTSLSAFDAASILIVLAAVLGFIDHQYLKLPSAIGLTVMGAVASLVVIGIDRLVRHPAPNDVTAPVATRMH